MAPHLSPQVIAAIETAVECNEGLLDSAIIHSLAKIYKTSPQAVVWNMKRYNKVKAGCDDRQRTGRRATMNKDAAAEAMKEWLAESPGEKFETLCNKLNDKFGVRVSTTWVSRVIKGYNIQYKLPKSPKIRKESSLKASKVPNRPNSAPWPVENAGQCPTFTQQYQLPEPGQYPSFRQDLQQAIGTLPVEPNEHSDQQEQLRIIHHDDRETNLGAPYGTSKSQLPPTEDVASPNHYSYQPQYSYQQSLNPTYQLQEMISPSISTSSSFSDSSLPPREPMKYRPNLQKQAPSATATASNWKVLRVVELP